MKKSLVICVAILIAIMVAMALVYNKRNLFYMQKVMTQLVACVIKAYGDPHDAKEGFFFCKGKKLLQKIYVYG